MRLSELPKGVAAWVDDVESAHATDAIARRLRDLGFVRGEPVRISATGPFGADPLLVRIGDTRFALRRSEAARVRVSLDADVAAATSTPADSLAAREVPVAGTMS